MAEKVNHESSNLEPEQAPTISTNQEPEKDTSTDWEAKYRETLAHSRRWEKLAKQNRDKIAALQAQSQKKTPPKPQPTGSSSSSGESVEERLAALEAENQALKAAQERQKIVEKIAKEQKVNPSLLARMVGDTEEQIEQNAELLKENLKPSIAEPVPGAQSPSSRAIQIEVFDPKKEYSSPYERIRARAAQAAARRQAKE